MDTEEMFGITLPVSTWKALFALSGRADRLPSDYLRTLIQREAARELEGANQAEPQQRTGGLACAV